VVTQRSDQSKTRRIWSIARADTQDAGQKIVPLVNEQSPERIEQCDFFLGLSKDFIRTCGLTKPRKFEPQASVTLYEVNVGSAGELLDFIEVLFSSS